MAMEKPLTSIRRQSKRLGFTLIEVSVVVLILAMFAALVVPRLVAMQKSQDYRTFVSATRSAFGYAREMAIESKTEYRLKVNESQRQVELVRGVDQGSEQQADRTVSMPEGVTVSKVRLDGTDTSTDTWEVIFYPDGTSSRAGVEFSSDGRQIALQVDDVTGRAKFIDGELPDETDTKWQAGEREQRGG